MNVGCWLEFVGDVKWRRKKKVNEKEHIKQREHCEVRNE
jgi:hypothetical protein